MVVVGRGNQQVFDGEEGAVAQKGDNSLMGIGFGGASELVAGFECDTDSGGTRQRCDLFEPRVAALAGDGDAVEAAGTGSNGLFNGVEAKKNFHHPSLQGRGEWGIRTISALQHFLSSALPECPDGSMEEKGSFFRGCRR